MNTRFFTYLEKEQGNWCKGIKHHILSFYNERVTAIKSAPKERSQEMFDRSISIAKSSLKHVEELLAKETNEKAKGKLLEEKKVAEDYLARNTSLEETTARTISKYEEKIEEVSKIENDTAFIDFLDKMLNDPEWFMDFYRIIDGKIYLAHSIGAFTETIENPFKISGENIAPCYSYEDCVNRCKEYGTCLSKKENKFVKEMWEKYPTSVLEFEY